MKLKKLVLSKAQHEAVEQQTAQLVVTMGISMMSIAALTAVKAVTEAKKIEAPQSSNN